MKDIVERLREKRGVLDNRWPGPTLMDEDAAREIERLRTQVSDLKDDLLRRHRDACDRWGALMDIRMIANEPGDRRALIDRIYGIATKALRPSTPAPPSPIGGEQP